MNPKVDLTIKNFNQFAKQKNIEVVEQKVIPGGIQLITRCGPHKQMLNIYNSGKLVVQGKSSPMFDLLTDWVKQLDHAKILPVSSFKTTSYKLEKVSGDEVLDKLQWVFANEIRPNAFMEEGEIACFQIARGDQTVRVGLTVRTIAIIGNQGSLLAEVKTAVEEIITEITTAQREAGVQRGSFITTPAFHGNSTHFRYRITNMKWEGPTMKAIEALNKAEGVSPMRPEDYLSYLQRKYHDIYSVIDWVTFYTFPWRIREPGGDLKGRIIELRIAVTHMQPYPDIRDGLYDMREHITNETGWYPLVQGSKAWIMSPPYHQLLKREPDRSAPGKLRLGSFTRLKDVSSGDGGSCFLLEGTKGSLLLDAGFSGPQERVDNLSGIFLSHMHRDHSGGLPSVMQQYNVPLVLSETSLSNIWYSSDINLVDKKSLVTRSKVIENNRVPLESDTSIRVFPVFHAPGSYGINIIDRDGRSIYYLGDICLKNGFMDRSAELYDLLQLDDSKENWVFLDASMATKPDFSIEDEDAPQKIVEESLRSMKRNIIFVSDSAETLIYTFVLGFYLSRGQGETQTKIVLNDYLYRLSRRIIRPVLLKRYGSIDPFVFHLIGNKIINFIESHRVYPMASLSYFTKDLPLAIFATMNDLREDPILRERVQKSDVHIVGTLALREGIPPEVSEAKPRSVLRIASPDWSFHSGPEDLAAFIRRLNQKKASVVLFHNFPKNIAKFIRQYDLDQNLVMTCSKEGIPLGAH